MAAMENCEGAGERRRVSEKHGIRKGDGRDAAGEARVSPSPASRKRRTHGIRRRRGFRQRAVVAAGKVGPDNGNGFARVFISLDLVLYRTMARDCGICVVGYKMEG
jgi:hypothetical protein